MLAARINDAVEQRLRAQHAGQQTLYRRELGICVGASRVDLAAVNGCITGCEIKSGSDGLARLPQQSALYGRVLDLAILVVERVHPERIVSKVPGWWGLWHAVDAGEGRTDLQELRAPERNGDVQALAVAQLLWRDEAFELLRDRELHRGLSAATRWRLWEALAAELPLHELQAEVRQRLRARREW